MTTYPINYFDGTEGILEQLLLAVIAQKLANKEYKQGLLDTGFVENSIDYNVTLDSVENGEMVATLNLSLTFPTMPYERQILADSDDFSRRIMSVNTAHISNSFLPRKATYPQRSLTPILPAYLNTASNENSLERRIFSLAYSMRNVLNWIARWNSCAQGLHIARFFTTGTIQQNFNAYYAPIKSALDLELVNGFTFAPIPVNPLIIPPAPVQIGVSGEPGTFSELAAEFGVSDPYSNSDNASKLSEGLLAQLTSSPQQDPTTPDPVEQTSLPDC